MKKYSLFDVLGGPLSDHKYIRPENVSTTTIVITGPIQPKRKEISGKIVSRFHIPCKKNGEQKILDVGQITACEFTKLSKNFRARHKRKWFFRILEKIKLLKPKYCTDIVDARAIVEILVDEKTLKTELVLKGVERMDLTVEQS